jgi:hypothetical protein
LGLVKNVKIPQRVTNSLGQSTTYASRQGMKMVVKQNNSWFPHF